MNSTVMLRGQLGACTTAVLATLLLGSCGGGGGAADSTPAAPVACASCNSNTADQLTVGDVQTVIEQAVGEAKARGLHATIAVADRVGNILALYRMRGAAATVTITSGRGVVGGLEGANGIADSAAAEAKAITAAYLSSNGNAFSTRTASQLIQENFDPGDTNQPAGPLFGVQFSQLPCGDVLLASTQGLGPHASPLGLSAGPGGLPLYKNAVVVGAVGVVADGLYTLDSAFATGASNMNEAIVLAASTGFTAPPAITADKITVGGLALRYTNATVLQSTPATHASFDSLGGALAAGPGFTGTAVLAGQAFGSANSGVRADTLNYADLGGYVLVDDTNQPRFPPTASADGSLAASDVKQMLRSALQVANHTRAQIRQPLNTVAQVSITVVDRAGRILGLVRSADAPVFGIDVAVQKARTALFFSDPGAASSLAALPPASYPASHRTSPIGEYVAAAQSFFGNAAVFADGTAYSTRAIAEISRPFYPDGINGNAPGPLSKAYAAWSIFDDGLQLDLSINAILGTPGSCTGLDQVTNGIQIFAGAVPIYKSGLLVGAIGVSGDGTSQDDLIAFLGLANASTLLGDGVGNAPSAKRADRLAPGGTGTHLDYVLCPQTPFVDTNQQDVCSGL